MWKLEIHQNAILVPSCIGNYNSMNGSHHCEAQYVQKDGKQHGHGCSRGCVDGKKNNGIFKSHKDVESLMSQTCSFKGKFLFIGIRKRKK